MAKKKGKSKTSSIKRSNQLRNRLIKQGKFKTRRNRIKPKKVSRQAVPERNIKKNFENEEGNSDSEEIMLDMVEEEDIKFIKNAVLNKSYKFLKNINITGAETTPVKTKKPKLKATDDLDTDAIEQQYEQSNEVFGKTKRKKYLLPIKTSEGIVLRSEEVNENDIEENIDDSTVNISCSEKEVENIKEATTADLLACRQTSLLKYKFRIGSLCSGLTENPEVKIKNFKPLLEMMSKNDPEVCITIKKLAVMSLLEVFKDLLPAYQLRHHNDSKIKLKKAVKQLHNYENSLLKYYKEYLQKLEKTVLILKRKKGDNRVFKEAEVKLAEMSLQCLCDLVTTHPYFNFSKNIVHLLVPFLNNSRATVRAMVSSTIKELFKTDKRGEISLEIVRNINKLVKSKTNIVHSEVLTVCLSLKIKDVNLDKEKEEELKNRKETAMKHKYMKMSKRERKRHKKFQELEKELLETKAEENKKSKDHFLTEVTKILFTTYFRILKVTPSSKLLNAALEGLAKFSHCINVEFYHDLILVLNNLIQNEELGYKEKLSCIQTVFTVLHYQGASINIDPIKFYSHFYVNLFKIHAGKNHSDLPVILKTTDFILLKRRKHLSLQRLLAFTKRLAALALHVLPNGSLALLSLVKQILQVDNSTDLLLDLDSDQAQGVYYPEMGEPEYCNANATLLWELLSLQRHYHPTVCEYSNSLAKSSQKTQELSQLKIFSKHSPEALFNEFDSSGVKFNPPVPSPKKFAKRKQKPGIIQEDFKDYIQNILESNKININELYLKDTLF